MASSEYGGPEEAESFLEEADIYKATSSSDYVVLRRVRLFRSKFTTYHDISQNAANNKQWILTAQCELQPRTASEIATPSTKYERPRGQWAITTLVKAKSIGTKAQPLSLYMFMLSWPTRWAAKGYTSFTFGFRTLEAARHWHNRLAECLARLDKSASTMQSMYSSASGRSAGNNLSLAGNGGGSGGGAVFVPRGGAAGTAAAAAGAAADASGLPNVARSSADGLAAAAGDQLAQQPGGPVASAEDRPSRTLALETAKRALVYESGATTVDVPVSASTKTSSFASATTAAAVAAAHGSGGAAAAMPPKPRAPVSAAPAPPPNVEGAFAASSSDSDESGDDSNESGVPQHARQHKVQNGGRGSSSMLGPRGSVCRLPRGHARGDVQHAKQRWVPYKQVNGVAIYHRPQTAGDAEAGVGGEFMVSTVVRGCPKRCLSALTSNCGNTTILGPAMVLEVLQPRQALDEREVQRIILQAPGLTGSICAPRELVVETVFKTDDAGPTLVLMFNSCEVPARFVEYHPGQKQQQQQPEVQVVQSASEGVRRSWWRKPVLARVRGGYTIAPLEEYSLDNSPESLVTCIMKVDLGGVCGRHSWMRLASDLVGWTDAFLDRMLMAVTLLRDEVEQGRFVVQPLNMMASSKVKERERDGGSVSDLVGMAGLRSGDSSAQGMAGAAAAGGGAGAVGGVSLRRRSSRLPAGARAVAGPGSRPGPVLVGREASGGGSSTQGQKLAAKSRRRETDRPSLVDVARADAGAAGAKDATAALAAGPDTADASGLTPAASEPGGAGSDDSGLTAAPSAVSSAAFEGSPLASPSARQHETMEDVLARMRSLSFLDPQVWDNLHQPGKDAPFKIRGPTYLKDRKKIPAGFSRFVLASMDVIQQPPGPVHEHVARFIPAIRQSGAPFSFIIHLVIPGTPLLGIVATFVSDRHPSQLGPPPGHPMEDDHDWEPFDFVLHKYMNGTTHTRNHMLKLIPHIADGSWMIKQSVGTTPVILGKQLRTIYYETPSYIEIDIDISANNVASYVTGLVRGATRSLVIDMGFVLEGTTPWELPEALLGTLRLYNLDIRTAKLIDVNNEIPLAPPTVPPPSPLRGTAGTAPQSRAPSAPPSALKMVASQGGKHSRTPSLQLAASGNNGWGGSATAPAGAGGIAGAAAGAPSAPGSISGVAPSGLSGSARRTSYSSETPRPAATPAPPSPTVAGAAAPALS